MKTEKPIFWHQGIVIEPLHFQLLDRVTQGLFTPYQKLLMPHFWGVGGMNIRKEALETKTFDLQSGEFMFRDGTFISLHENALIKARVFDDAWVEGGKPFNVYLGVRKLKDFGENVTVLPTYDNIGPVYTRFVGPIDFEEITDMHEGNSVSRAKKLHYLLKIFWETEQAEFGEYDIIQIAQLERFGSEIRLCEDFIPPCISYSASESLHKLIKEIRDQVKARGHQLEEHKSKRGIQTAEFGSRDMVYFLALRSVNRYVPLLYHYTETEHIHPWHIYGVLRQLIGELTSFSERFTVLGELDSDKQALPEYDHKNLWGCFFAAQEMISHLLDEITAGPEYVVSLVNDGKYFSTELKTTIFEGRNRFYLAVRTEEDPKNILKTLGNIAKLSSREQLGALVSSAVPGIGLQYLQIPPQELPRRANTIYFAIDHNNDQWGLVAKHKNLALFWVDAPENVEIELMVVGR